MKKHLLIILLIATSIPSYAKFNVDSVWNIWQDKSKPDSVRLINLVDYYKNGLTFNNPDSALTLAKLHLSFAMEKGFKSQYPSAYNNIGTIYYLLGDLDKSLEYYNKAVTQYLSINKKDKAAGTLNNMGLIYGSKGNYLKSIESFKKALSYANEDGYEVKGAANINIGNVYKRQSDYLRAIDYFEIGLKNYRLDSNKQGIANALSSFGSLYYEKGENSKALEYYNKSLKLDKEIGNNLGVSRAYISLGNIYSAEKKNELAIDYFNKSLTLSTKIQNKQNQALALNNMAMSYKELGDLDKAMEDLGKSYEINQISERQDIMAMNLVNFGSLYRAMGKYKLSDEWSKKAINFCKKLNALSYMQSAYMTLYENSKKKGNYKLALDYYQKINELDDSLKSNETYRKLQQMEFRNEMTADSLKVVKREAIKDLEIKSTQATLDKQNYLIVGIAIALILITIIAYVIYKGKKTSDSLLLNILPENVAKELKEKGYSSAKEFEKATILFTDFKDFSKICNNLKANELVAEIDYYFKKFDGISEKYGLEKIKTIGDSYMVAGGLNSNINKSIKNTVLAGLEMQEVVKLRASQKEEIDSNIFEMRVGVHTGPVIAGIVGVKKFQFDLWGETVNTASRMETYGVIGEVNLSQSTYDLINKTDEFLFEARDGIEVKSLGKVNMYLVRKKL